MPAIPSGRTSRFLYLNLNESFLGVAFEAQSGPPGEEPEINPAQVRAAADLTEMLRARYGIPPGNCVTHAQVSVNPSNMRVGTTRIGLRVFLTAISACRTTMPARCPQ